MAKLADAGYGVLKSPGIYITDVAELQKVLLGLGEAVESRTKHLFDTHDYSGGFESVFGEKLSLGQPIYTGPVPDWKSGVEKLHKRMEPPWQPNPRPDAKRPYFSSSTPVGEGGLMTLSVNINPVFDSVDVYPEGLLSKEMKVSSINSRKWQERERLIGEAIRLLEDGRSERSLSRHQKGVYRSLENVFRRGLRYYYNPKVSRQNVIDQIDIVSEILGGSMATLKKELAEAEAECEKHRKLRTFIEIYCGVSVEATLQPGYQIRLVDQHGKLVKEFSSRTKPTDIPKELQVKVSRTQLYWQNVSPATRKKIGESLTDLYEQLRPEIKTPTIDLANVDEFKQAIEELTAILEPHIYANIQTRSFDPEYEPTDPTQLPSNGLVLLRTTAGWTSYMERTLDRQLKSPWKPNPQLGKRIPEYSAYDLIKPYFAGDVKEWRLNVSVASAVRCGVEVVPVGLRAAREKLESLMADRNAELRNVVIEALGRLQNPPKRHWWKTPDVEAERVYTGLTILAEKLAPGIPVHEVIRKNPEHVARVAPTVALRKVDGEIEGKREEISGMEEMRKKIDIMSGIGVSVNLEPHYESKKILAENLNRINLDLLSEHDKENVANALTSLAKQLSPVKYSQNSIHRQV